MNVVLAAIDATEAARPVLATAVGLSHTLQVATRALHVAGEGNPRVPADLAEEFDVPFELAGPAAHSDKVAAIVAAAEDPDVSAVVLALHGLPGGAEAGPDQQPTGRQPGRTALAVTAQVTKPVVVVPPDQPITAAPRRVLFPLDGTHRVSTAVHATVRTYVEAGFEAIAVHVFEPKTVPRFLDGPADAVIWADEFAARQHVAELGVRLVVGVGEPVAKLLQVADAEDVDMIALGWRQDLSAERSRVVRGILARSTRPVALIPFLGERAWERA